MTPQLSYMQRKALRRLGRGQSITHTMAADPLIQRCYTTDHYEHPDPYLNVVDYCDWQARSLINNLPRITDYGKKLLAELDGEERSTQ